MTWDAILADPDADTPWWVHADWLLARGDPRGHLAALSRSDPECEAARRYRFEHREVLLGPLFERADPWIAEWRHGYLARLELVVDAYTRRTAQTLRWLSRDGGHRGLRRLRLCSAARFDRAFEAMAEVDWPLLEDLEMGPMSIGAGRIGCALRPTLSRMPRLKRLRLEWTDDLESLAHPALEALVLHCSPECLSDLDLAGLPALRRLELYSREPVDPELLEGIRLRRWERLALHDHVIAGWLDGPGLPVDTLVVPGAWEVAAAERAGRVEVFEWKSPDRDPLLTPATQLEWRRFVKGKRFWQMRRDGSTVRLRYGALGKRGTERSRDLASPWQASRDYRERHAAKRDEGYVEVWVDRAERVADLAGV